MQQRSKQDISWQCTCTSWRRWCIGEAPRLHLIIWAWNIIYMYVSYLHVNQINLICTYLVHIPLLVLRFVINSIVLGLIVGDVQLEPVERPRDEHYVTFLVVKGKMSHIQCTIGLDNGGKHPQHVTVMLHYGKRVHKILETIIGAVKQIGTLLKLIKPQSHHCDFWLRTDTNWHSLSYYASVPPMRIVWRINTNKEKWQHMRNGGEYFFKKSLLHIGSTSRQN